MVHLKKPTLILLIQIRHLACLILFWRLIVFSFLSFASFQTIFFYGKTVYLPIESRVVPMMTVPLNS